MLLMGGTYPPDIRVEKEARALREAGHEVYLLTSDKRGGSRVEQIGPLTVRRYRHRVGALRSKIDAIVTLASWRQPGWERAIERFTDATAADVLHVHDLPAVKTAVAVAHRRGLPVVFDMHENYAAAVTFWKRPFAARLFQTPKRYSAYERWAVRAVDTVVCVVEEARNRVIALGAEPDRVVVFGNVDDCAEGGTWTGPTEPFTIAYAGGFGTHRGIDVLLRAFAIARRKMPDSQLLLMGSGPDEGSLRELAFALGVGDAVQFLGWVSEPKMRERLSSASVGVVPHLKNEHTDSTVPHKLFQYMCIGLPVVVTDCAPLERIVKETGAGVVARAGDAASLAEAIMSLVAEDRSRAASKAGLDAVEARYSLAHEAKALAAVYDSHDRSASSGVDASAANRVGRQR